MALNVFSCSSPADCYQRPVVQLLAAGGISMGNMSERHDLISDIFCSRVVFSALSNMKPNLPVPSEKQPTLLQHLLPTNVPLQAWRGCLPKGVTLFLYFATCVVNRCEQSVSLQFRIFFNYRFCLPFRSLIFAVTRWILKIRFCMQSILINFILVAKLYMAHVVFVFYFKVLHVIGCVLDQIWWQDIGQTVLFVLMFAF